MQVFTIGHSTGAVQDLLARLTEHGIEAVADVRTAPYSARAPHFNRVPLAASLKEAGIQYAFLGAELGGRPPGDLREGDGRADYDRMAETAEFRAGIQRVLEGASRFKLALLCSEGKHTACHRWLLVGRVLIRDHGVDVVHIQADGSVTVEPPEMFTSLGRSKKPVPS